MNPTVYVREPEQGCLRDWNGNELQPDALDMLNVGNTVRIIISDDSIGWTEAIYVNIVQIVATGFLIGEVLGTYRHMVPEHDGMEPIADGEIIQFNRHCVTEIPFDWKGNENLSSLAQMRTGARRHISGVPPEAFEIS